MKRNNLVLWKPHAEKRTEIRDIEVDEYLNSLADAIIKFGIFNVLNMDEKRVNTFSPQVKAVFIKGQETVKINSNHQN